MAPLSAAQLATRQKKLTGEYNPVQQAAYQASNPLGTPSVPPAITAQNLATPTNPVALPPAQTPTAATGLAAYIETLTANAKKAAETSQNDYQSAISDYLNKGNEQLNLEKKAGIDEKTKKVNELTSQIEAEQLSLKRKVEAIQKAGGGLESGQNTEINRLTRESASYQADLAIQQTAANRDLLTTQSLINRKIELKYEPLKLKIDFLKEFNAQNQQNLTAAEKNQLSFLTSQEERTYQEGVLQDKRAYDGYTKAAENGAPQAVLQQIQSAINSGDYQSAQQLAMPYFAKPRTAPTVKTINGVDMQWNPTTGAWETIGATTTNEENTTSQLQFLRDTAAEAIKLSTASGASGISKFIGDKLVGDTKFRQLESLTNTLRTNVLTLMTDPSVKKYFGPQMSEADVRLMTAAGTTLNPDNQSPKQMKAEVERLDNLFKRMQDAVNKGRNDVYSVYRSALNSGEILIQRGGQIGAILPSEFNPQTDKKL